MAFLIQDFIKTMERMAPAALAEEWDNVGLQAGGRGDGADRVMVALGVTLEVLAEARAAGCGLILTHHPLIFAPVASLSDDSETGRLVRAAHEAGIAIFAAHTNLDAAPGGLADVTAELLGLLSPKPLPPAAAGRSKLVTFVPEVDLERVKAALFAAGAGTIGDYRHCSFTAAGTGSFLPVAGAHPSIGEVGRDELVPEMRLEMIFPTGREGEIVAALAEASSYEEPAYDIYPLESVRHNAGIGRLGEISPERPLADLAGMAAELFGLSEARYLGDAGRSVRRIAVAPGGGASLIPLCAARGADALVSGDFRYHDALRARELGLALVEVPHEVSEAVALQSWSSLLERELSAAGVKVIVSETANSFWQTAQRREQMRLSPEEETSMHHLYVDGGSRGNPGPAAIGAVLRRPDGDTVETLANFIGDATNNIAEYQALIAGVEMALDHDVGRLSIFSDSELIVRQLQGIYRVKNEGLRPYYQQAKSTLARLERFELKSIPRESNQHADSLVNQALDEAVG